MSYLAAHSVSVQFSLGKKRNLKASKTESIAGDRLFSALQGINLELTDGARLGVIGENGAGKTTLLRVLSEMLPPSTGTVEVQGRLQSVITMSTGLINPASCTENIRLRGLSYRLSGQQLEAYIESVKENSELGKFLSLPVKSLSSGMRSRLIMTMFLAHQPEILIMDEWIGVADRMQFNAKNSTSSVIEDCNILVLATHRHKLIEKYCNCCLVLDKGRQQYLGDVDAALAYYEAHSNCEKS